MPRSRAGSSGRAERSRAGSSSPAARRPPRPIRPGYARIQIRGDDGEPRSCAPARRAASTWRSRASPGPPAELPVDLGAARVAPHRRLERGLAILRDHLERERRTATRGEDRFEDPGLDHVVLRVVVELPEVHDLRGPGAVRDLARRRVDVGLGVESEHWPRLRGGPGAGAPGEEQAGREDPQPRSARAKAVRGDRDRRTRTERRERRRGRHPGRRSHRVSSATR